MSEKQPDEVADDRTALLSAAGPDVNHPGDALLLLADLAEQSDDFLAAALRGDPVPEDERAEHHRRRAYVWVRVAEHRSEFEPVAEAEIRAWQKVRAAEVQDAEDAEDAAVTEDAEDEEVSEDDKAPAAAGG
ncbi:hypothetical protein LKL35_31095 [Streptomyces sp. ET3-23]|uniref:hypothetical protein n=1 Tax=Streptomyces sp. ET3-23 TaxID=2885643 RepID=UPI001D0F4BA8|nr:hypothetical protein [Streptomyces sp. ET3-23]MCC2279842.1 hypothetical protein [Streptomyces sp. ET3-23]